MKKSSLPFIEKYRAESFSDLIGQETAIQDALTFYKTFPMKKALILNGSVGTGKTSLVHALAKEFNLELFELNASDLRNKSSLEEVLKPSLEQVSLFKSGKIILMDEADGITATDRGGLPELISLIQKTKYPIIITANDIWQKKFSLLRQKCKLINLKELSEENSKIIIKKILTNEQKQLSSRTIEILAKKARGDVRAILNDLESVLISGEELFIEELAEREKQDTIFNALKKLFQSPTTNETLRIFDDTKMELNEIMLWIEENIPLEYSGKALAKSYDSLSKADVFKGRIYRQQHWRFMVYMNFFLSAGISSATGLKYNRFKNYNKPSRILKIWLSNQRNAKKKSIITKYAQHCHMSKKKANKDNFILPLILSTLDEKTKKRMDFDEKEQEYINEKKAALIVANNLNKFRI